MHPEHIERAISAAAHGSKVAIFAASVEQAQALAHDVEAAAQPQDIERIRRINGKYSIDFKGGGRIHFISTRQSSRGLSLDRAFVPLLTDRDTLENIIPSLCTSQEGVLTGY